MFEDDWIEKNIIAGSNKSSETSDMLLGRDHWRLWGLCIVLADVRRMLMIDTK